MRHLLFLLLVLGFSGMALDFPDVDNGRDLEWDKLYPQGRIFPYSGFSPFDVVANRDAGFTLAGPSYGKGIEKLQSDCQSNDIPFIYSLQPLVNGEPVTLKLLSSQEFKPDWAMIRTAIKEQVKEAAGKYPQIAWWNLIPEELRFWRKHEYRYLQEAYQAIREADPLQRPVWMYIPNHYSLDALSKYVEHQDILGKGMYVNYAGHTEKRIWVRWSSESLMQSIRGMEQKKFALCVPEMFQEQPDGKRDRIEARVRHDVYLALATGCRGVVIYSLAKRKGLSPETHQAYYDAYKRIAGELTGKEGLGQVFLFGERRQDLQGAVATGSAPLTIRPVSGRDTEFTYPAATMAEFLYRKARYLVVVNSAETETIYELPGFPKDILISGLFSTPVQKADAADTLRLKLSPLEVLLLKLEPRP